MRTVRKCRVCGTNLPNPYLNLGKTPLASSYIKSEEIPKEQGYELAVALCPNCKLSQLTIVVPPNLMFKHYFYVSSTTRTFRTHCDDLAAGALGALLDHPIAPTVLDIGSNDGCLLSCFRERGAQVIGVDPAENLAAETNARGIQTICAFWGSTAAEEVFRLVGQPVIITATNVLAHVDGLHDFLTCVESILSDAGLFILEVPYLVDLMQKSEFDTIYHEHLSYFLVRPLQYAVEAHGLKIVDIQHRPIHGGTIRVSVAKRSSNYYESTAIAQFLIAEQEQGFYDNASYESFANTVESNKRKMLELLGQLVSEGKRIAGYGAAAKGNTFQPCPSYAYGIAKLQAEQGLLSLADESFSVYCLRKGTVCGISSRQRFDIVLNTMVKDAITLGRVTVFDPNEWRPVISVSDAARVYNHIILNRDFPPGVYNVAEGNYIVEEIGRLVVEACARKGLQVELRFSSSSSPRSYKADLSKLRHYIPHDLRWQAPDQIAEELLQHVLGKSPDYFSKPRFYNVQTFKQLFPSEGRRSRLHEQPARNVLSLISQTL